MQLYIAGLPLDLYDQELKEVFEEFGAVTSAHVILDRETRQSRGFGFVDMPDDEAAQVAMDELNVSELDGKRLTVRIAEGKKPAGNIPRREGNRYHPKK